MTRYRNVLSTWCKVKFKQGVAEQKKWAVYEDVDGGGDLWVSQEKKVGNLSESCISQKKRIEVKLETAVDSNSEKNSRACFLFPLVLQKTHNLPCRGKEMGMLSSMGYLKTGRTTACLKPCCDFLCLVSSDWYRTEIFCQVQSSQVSHSAGTVTLIWTSIKFSWVTTQQIWVFLFLNFHLSMKSRYFLCFFFFFLIFQACHCPLWMSLFCNKLTSYSWFTP